MNEFNLLQDHIIKGEQQCFGKIKSILEDISANNCYAQNVNDSYDEFVRWNDVDEQEDD